jgi:BirA family biotin operon repressor/biotin-[acetyl-CoA-carboxylase] ligase
MAADGLQAALEALPPTWHARYLAAVDSTQDEARVAARAGAPSRSLFVADYQRAGRGRQGRRWMAAPGVALLLSMLFRETTTRPARPWRWTSLASVALVEAIEELAPGVQPAIKWPNDVMLGDRKLAGILAETSWNGLELQAIVGVGVNVNSGARELATFPSATSLKIASGRQLDRGQLLQAVIQRVDCWIEQPADELHAAWESRLWGRGQRLRLRDQAQDQEVIVLSVASDGSLRVRLADGSERQTTTGELLQ